MHEHLALVVDGPPRIKVLIALGRLEWGSSPFIERVGRLHIVMPVAERGRLAGCMQPIGIHQRVSCCLDDLHVFQSDGAHLHSEKIGRAFDVGLVLGQSADARDAQQIL